MECNTPVIALRGRPFLAESEIENIDNADACTNWRVK